MLSLRLIGLTCLSILMGCSSTHTPIRTEPQVDLSQFMGDWYVIANIPTFIEKGAHNAVESYAMNEDGAIDTTFRFRKDSFDGEIKTYHPTGYVNDDPSNAIWGMQFVWPIKADYRIVYLNENYTQTIIGREKRDYVWIMARTPTIPDADYRELISLLTEEGYDTSLIQKVPQQWPEKSE